MKVTLKVLLAGIVTILPLASGETVESRGIKIVAEGGEVRVQNGEAETVLTLSGLHLKGVAGGRTRNGRILEAGKGSIVVEYETGTDAEPSPTKVTASFTARPWAVDVRFRVKEAPADAQMGASMFMRRFGDSSAVAGEVLKPALWTRHKNGGVPYEVPEGQAIPYKTRSGEVVFLFSRENKVNLGWKDAWSQHAGLAKMEDGMVGTNFTIILPPSNWPEEALAAKASDRPLALRLSTGKTYHLWEDASAPLRLKTDVFNLSSDIREAELEFWGRDFSGNIIGEGKRPLRLEAGGNTQESLDVVFPGTRGMVFVEVSVRDKASGKSVFARTNLSVLPPHVFKSTPENSLFGLAAYWPVPDEVAVRKLMERMGVRWLRDGDGRTFTNITAIHHSNPAWSGAKALKGKEREAWIRKKLQQCLDEKNPWWEYGNELNMSTAGIAMEGVGIGQALLAEAYVEGLREAHRIRKEMNAEHIKILSFGMAGMDLKFVEKFRQLGGWELIDGFALHPGRGNVTPDYPVTDPTAAWEIAPKGGYWNYYGSVKTAALMLKEYGGNKPLWLTEIYAPTFPNSFWEDSMRHATENVVLTFALAQAEGVKAAMWYQLFDSVWYDRFGANEKNREYHFGLVNRDLSLKPLVLAYATAAEALDEARFQNWIPFADPDVKGMLFTSPRGPVAILWSRKDGYTLSRKVPDYPSPEPWVDQWKTRTVVEIPAAEGKLRVIDVIGSEEEVEADNAAASIRLSGAPVIVYGVDVGRLGAGR